MTIDEYILQHIDPEGEYLHALYRDTHLKLLYPRMASGHLQGRMLKMFVRMIHPRQVLEIGTYSGYSALCIAEGLPEGSLLHTFEINDEQEDFTRPWLEGSSYADRIKFYIGDALKRVPELGLTFDMVFMDGDKRKYVDYYEMALSVMCWKSILALRICKPLAYKRSTTLWHKTNGWRKLSSPCAMGLRLFTRNKNNPCFCIFRGKSVSLPDKYNL